DKIHITYDKGSYDDPYNHISSIKKFVSLTDEEIYNKYLEINKLHWGPRFSNYGVNSYVTYIPNECIQKINNLVKENDVIYFAAYSYNVENHENNTDIFIQDINDMEFKESYNVKGFYKFDS